MKKLALSVIVLFVIAGCGGKLYPYPSADAWWPEVGCTKADLESHWGVCCGSHYDSRYGYDDVCWYHKVAAPLQSPFIVPGYRSPAETWMIVCNYAVHIHNGVVESVSTHY